MVYDLSNEIHRQLFSKRAERLLERRGVVELCEKQQRTIRQNDYLHLLLGALALETGTTLAYAKEQYYKREANAALFVRVRRDEWLQKDVEVLRSSRDLTKEEMTFSIQRLKMWADSNGFCLPDESDEAILREIKLQMAIAQQYL